MYVQNVSIPVNTAVPSADGTLTAQTTFSFPTNVITVSASVASFTVSYGTDDHHVKTVGASVSVQIQSGSPTVTITGTVQMVDNSAHVPNAASCSLTATVVAWAE
jgi:hypothetical protein